jgi:aspartate kinase
MNRCLRRHGFKWRGKMKILVQKFGGTSVSTPERRQLVVEKVAKAKSNGFCPVVVVSAMGRLGESYATDTLLSLLSSEFRAGNPLATDLLMSCGEIISAVVMCAELNKHSIDSIPITGGQAGIKTDENFGDASVLNVDTPMLLSLLKSGKVPVVTGFQGVSETGFITTLGRGGSDVTAALLGAALNAEEVEIYTDVDGIMTADPRIVGNASLIRQIGYNEVFQFADQGAKVIHPRAVEVAMNSKIVLSIKNTMSDSVGTIISGRDIPKSNNIITGITHMSERVQVTINQAQNQGNTNFNSLLDVLANNSISIDLINVFPGEKIFTIDSTDKNIFERVMNNLKLNYNIIERCSKIAIIGSGMRGIPGVMATIVRTLELEGIEILQTADSHMTIWCLVREEHTKKAINALHREFKLGV